MQQPGNFDGIWHLREECQLLRVPGENEKITKSNKRYPRSVSIQNLKTALFGKLKRHVHPITRIIKYPDDVGSERILKYQCFDINV